MPNLNKVIEADKWIESIIKTWIEISQKGIQDQSSKLKDYLLELKTFLYSFPPKINKEKNVKQIIEILKELKTLGQTAQID